MRLIMNTQIKRTRISARDSSLRALLAGSILSILTLLGMAASAEEIYRWVDDNGVVNYTQQKPRDVTSEAITTQSGGPRVVKEVPVPASIATGQPLNADQERMLDGLRAEERNRQQQIAQLKEDNCQKSRDVLSRLTIKNRIRVKDGTGEYQMMGEDERQDRISRAQEGIALYCVAA